MRGSSANQDVFTTRELSGREIIIRGKITASCAISCPRESKGGREGGREKKDMTRDAGVGRIGADASQRTEDQWPMTSRLVRVARARNRSRYHTRAAQDHPHAARIRTYRGSKMCTREVPRFISRPENASFSLKPRRMLPFRYQRVLAFLSALLRLGSFALCLCLSSSPIVHAFLRHPRENCSYTSSRYAIHLGRIRQFRVSFYHWIFI